jgi:putative intracellular protease/amidase
MAKIVMPIPARDFDPTEVAVPWITLTQRGHEVYFATPDGAPGAADDIMLTGEGLDPWGWMPGLRKLRVVGLMLRANQAAQTAYLAMLSSPSFAAPLQWDAVDARDFDGLILPGGHRARGMRDYLESPALQQLTVTFMTADKPVGAICHGTVLAARSIDPTTGLSVLYGRRTTALTWALERSASQIGRICRFWDPSYYRTYADPPGKPTGHMSVEAEVTRALEHPTHFMDVPVDDPDAKQKTSGLQRDTASDHRSSWVVQDRNYVSARWPGDAHAFSMAFARLFDAL